LLRARARSLMLWSCRLAGALSRFGCRGVVFHPLALLLIAAALGVADHLLASRPHAPWLTFWNVASLWVLGLIAWWVAQARGRLFIAAFDDYSGKAAGVDAQGLGVLVATELASLSDLFNEFEAGRPIQATPEKLVPVSASFQTESPSQFLEKAVSAETSFQLGPFKFPVGIVLNLIGRLVQGPRLAGQIHRDGDQRIVTVSLTGHRGELSWRIADAPSARDRDTPRWRPGADLAHELACRIFAEVTMDGAVGWQPLTKFVAGVGAYRQSLRTPKHRTEHLREAEHRLIEALAEDPHFDLAYYNLGVVHTEDRREQSALERLLRARPEQSAAREARLRRGARGGRQAVSLQGDRPL
jgi:hypothetical protein